MRSELVTAAVITRGGRVLVTQRHTTSRHPGKWEFPGGKVEAGETPEECMARELLEEMDIPVMVGVRLAQVNHKYPDIAIELIAFRCNSTADEIKNIGCAAHAWVSPEELSDYDLSPPDREIAALLFPEVDCRTCMPHSLFGT